MGTPETLYRSLVIGEAVGRTLSGLAVPWNTPQRVHDPGRPPYLEAFAPESCTRSLAHSPTRDLFVRHNYTEDPIGTATFHRSAEGLMFEAPVARTQRGDEYLELINGGAMRSVSVGFRPIQHLTRSEVTVRTEVALRELSLTPTGFGQYAEAGVTAVRDLTGDDAAEAAELRRMIRINAHRRLPQSA